MNISIKRKVAALTVTALTVVGGGAAIAAAQTGSRSEESQAIIADAAEELGVEATELNAALKQALIDSLDAKVAAGELSQAQANTLKAKIQSGDFPIIGGLHGPGFGRAHGFADLETAASFLGLTSAGLRAELDDGQTLAEVATEKGKKVDGLVQALVAAAEQRLAEDVSAGRLTQAQADARKADVEQRITDLVNGSFTGPPRPGNRPEAADAA